MTTYKVFVRNWWKRDASGRWVPDSTARKHVLGTRLSETEARTIHNRNRRVMVGGIEVARLVEYAMPSGVRQYVVSYIGVVRPPPKFDSEEQAVAHLESVLRESAEPLK